MSLSRRSFVQTMGAGATGLWITARGREGSLFAQGLQPVQGAAPSIILSGLCVYWARNALIERGFSVNEDLYLLIVIIVVSAAQGVTMKPIVAELRRRKFVSQKPRP